jgi:hypothetical protein
LKKFILTVLTLCVVFSVPACAVSLESYGFKLDIGDDYTVLTADNLSENSEFLEGMGHTVQSMKKYFSDNELILFAADRADGRQIQVKCAETDFTKQLGDLSLLGNDQVQDIANSILPEDGKNNYTLVQLGDITAYELESRHSDNIGQFCSRQYITIREGRLYSIVFFENGEKLSGEFLSEIDTALASLAIQQSKKVTANDAENLTEVIMVWVLIGVAAVFAVAMLWSLARDAFARRKEDKTVISRRKIK